MSGAQGAEGAAAAETTTVEPDTMGLTAEEMARQIGVCVSQVHIFGRDGVLPRQYYGNNERCLYAPLKGVKFVNGCGGRYRPRRPALIPAPSSTQEAT